MSKRYSGKSFKDSSVMKKPKHSLKEKRRLKKEKKTLKNIFFQLSVHLVEPKQLKNTIRLLKKMMQ